jgi:hypothetical protein
MVYQLKESLDSSLLNVISNRIFTPQSRIRDLVIAADRKHIRLTQDVMEDCIAGIYSRRSIVNPLTPENEMHTYYDDLPNGFEKEFVRKTIRIVSRKFPEVKHWIE